MNTATFHETQAIATGSTAAAIGASQELLLIPLSRLRPSSRNVRKSGGTSIPELASSIARVGLLQNLTVVAAPDGEHYEVVAGRRRLAALKLLVKRRKLAKAHEVYCLLVQDDAARTVSLTENVQREAMSPIEELFAWKDLVAEGLHVAPSFTPVREPPVLQRTRPHALPALIRAILPHTRSGECAPRSVLRL